jgi:dienelactone hydrolase
MSWPVKPLFATVCCGALLTATLQSDAARGAEPSGAAAKVHAVKATFNDSPFKYRMTLLSKRDGFKVYRLTYPSPIKTAHAANNTVPADYYVPDDIKPGDAKRPAVICLHILAGKFELVDIVCSALARRGIPAIMFKLPYYGERSRDPQGRKEIASDPALFVRAIRQGFQDVRRTIDVLSARSEVDPKHIGITGISLGGIVAAAAASDEPRLKRAVLVLAGGDLVTIINHARETRSMRRVLDQLSTSKRAEFEKTISSVDPLHLAAGLRKRATAGKVLMINASRDEVIPPSCTKKLADALGMADEVIWLDGLGHYTALAELSRTVRLTTEFFAKDLPSHVKPYRTNGAAQTPLQTTAQLLQQVATLLTVEPPAGRCHLADLKVTVTQKGKKPIEAELQIIRGSGHQFKLTCNLPKIGAVAIGQDTSPWMLAAGKRVFKGTSRKGIAVGNPLAGAQSQHLLKLRVVSGAAAALTISPDIVLRWVDVEDVTTKDGPKTLRFLSKKKSRDSDEVRLVFQSDGKTPASATFDVDGTKGTVTFRGWAMNTVAHPTMFQPPPKLPQQSVDSQELHRMFSAMFNFVMEHAQ